MADSNFALRQDARRRWVLERPDNPAIEDVRIRRAFPWTNTQQFVSIRSAEGKEILLIESLADLSHDQRNAIERALVDETCIARITHVDRIDMRFGSQEWSVQSDRGHRDFRVQEREDVRFLPDGRFAVKDADGNIYELPPSTEMDDHSRRMVEQLL